MLTMLDTSNVFGLYVVILTTMLFSVAESCSVFYTCSCNGVSLTDSKGNCESLVGGRSTYINCSSTCVIQNNAFEALPCKRCLDTVYLRYYNISDIQPDAFTGLKDLQVLYLDNNEIQELHQDRFQHVRALVKLDVSFNRLRYIHPESFVLMKSFFHLNVSHNALVLNGTILYSDYINILDAAFCNPTKDDSWYVLKRPVFSGLPNLTTLLLEGNAIQCVMWDTFNDNQRLTSLDLKNNMLKFIPHQITLCAHVIELDLSYNPLDCNCHLKLLAASCASNRLKLNEVSCGTSLGMEHLSCDDVSLTVTPDTGICDFDIGSTNAVTSTLLTSEGTSQDSTTSAVFSTTSETVMSSFSMYSDQHIPTSALTTSSENERSVESSGTTTTEIPDTLNQNPRPVLAKAPATSSSMWIIFGFVCVVVVIIVVVSVVVILRVCKRRDFNGWVLATHYFNFHSGSSNPETNNKVDKVDENYKNFRYISLGSLEKLTQPKKDLHYLCRDVITLPGMSAQGQRETGSCCCSVILEKNVATGCKNEDHEEHVYEEVI